MRPARLADDQERPRGEPGARAARQNEPDHVVAAHPVASDRERVRHGPVGTDRRRVGVVGRWRLGGVARSPARRCRSPVCRRRAGRRSRRTSRADRPRRGSAPRDSCSRGAGRRRPAARRPLRRSPRSPSSARPRAATPSFPAWRSPAGPGWTGSRGCRPAGGEPGRPQSRHVLDARDGTTSGGGRRGLGGLFLESLYAWAGSYSSPPTSSTTVFRSLMSSIV